jgi:membrane-bound lytic murein transglycosylase MltF
MDIRTRIMIVLVLLLTGSAGAAWPQDSELIMPILDRPVQESTDDLDAMRETGMIRVLTTYNRTNFFLSHKRIRGFEYELFTEYEKHLNKGVSRREIQTSLIFIPVSKNELIPFLLEGKGDIAAAALTVTDERSEQVAFTAPYLTDVDEIVITSAAFEDIETLADLSGRKVYVVKGSSYAEHLRTLNDWLAHWQIVPVEVVEVERHLETEDLLEMVNAGIIEVTIADRYLAELWSGVLDKIVLRPDLIVSRGGALAWAVRKDNPQLLADLNTFIRSHRKGTLLGNVLFKRYFENTKWITNPAAVTKLSEMETLFGYFQKYGEEYGIDWLGIAALAYQESRFDQKLKSRAGAVGIMQIKPTTAAEMGFPDISGAENNIHAGVQYLDWLRDTYFSGPELEPSARVDFTLASYNAGARRINGMRKKAAERGHDPNVWFGNVEHVTLKYVGQEPVQYVTNINKYYVALKLSYDKLLRREELKSGASSQ